MALICQLWCRFCLAHRLTCLDFRLTHLRICRFCRLRLRLALQSSESVLQTLLAIKCHRCLFFIFSNPDHSFQEVSFRELARLPSSLLGPQYRFYSHAVIPRECIDLRFAIQHHLVGTKGVLMRLVFTFRRIIGSRCFAALQNFFTFRRLHRPFACI